MFLLEHWQHDSSLSDDEQREKIFADFLSSSMSRASRYWKALPITAQRGLYKSSSPSLTPSERQLLDRVRLSTERFTHSDFVSWLRTSYEPSPSTEAAFSAIASALQHKFGEDIILDDSRLYDFGDDWQHIFLGAPQLLSVEQSVEEYNEGLQEALHPETEIESEPESDTSNADADADADRESEPEYEFDYTPYHWAMVIGRIHAIDHITLGTASECQGPDAADARKVLIVWYDACGCVVRLYRETVNNAADITAVDNAILDNNLCWLNGEVSENYRWGAALGPPYGARR
ncbi:hypothetical protein BJX65DRAFT_307992 [Aspergillus insuetus]